MPTAQINAGDTAWVLMAAALVMLMTPALGFFYGGLVQRKNVLSTLMHSFFILCLISVQWVLWGYSLAFGPDHFGLIGGLDWVGLTGVGLTPDRNYAPTVPAQAFMIFQMMFAVITPALITGAFAERKRFKAFVLFTLLWATFIYDPLTHWVWGHGGWLNRMGVLDFAGGTVVEISSGVSALVAAFVLGPRLGLERQTPEPHDATMAVLGASLLWFGWFGFNAGSALGAGALATSAFVATNTAAAIGALTWMTLNWAHKGQPTVLGACAGAISGMVAITPACGFVSPSGALLIGCGAGAVCYGALQLRDRIRLRCDDSLDVWAVHGVGGTWGMIATGIFATVAVHSAATGGGNGLLYGDAHQLAVQCLAAGVTWLFCAAGTYVILKVVTLFGPLRVAEEEEVLGLDASQHGEVAYGV
jgi:ammonium transporter, Amt family